MILFAKTQIIGGIFPNLIIFGIFLDAIGYFALIEKWQKCSVEKQQLTGSEVIAGPGARFQKSMGLVLTTVSRSSMA